MKLNLVTGLRPTGQLHIGHYFGVLDNLLRLQNAQIYNNYFFIADLHTLTSGYSETQNLSSNIIEVTKDFLACGLNPEESVIYQQSAITEISELYLLFSMFTPHNWLERVPTLKDLKRAAENHSITELSFGMLGYPLLQTIDILIMHGHKVPIGSDQVAHLEISRDIVRKFNNIYKTDYLPEPQALLTEIPLLTGIDGSKMSKSFNNDIKLADTNEQTIKQAKKMLTDPNRQKLTDAGNTEDCTVVWQYYQIFGNDNVNTQVKEDCHNANRGCVKCKLQLADLINDKFADIRHARQQYSQDDIQDILAHGNTKAKIKAQKTLSSIKKIMKI